MLDLLKIKIVRDLNNKPKFAGPTIGLIGSSSKHPNNYQKLLDLIENHIFYNYLEDYNKKITISDLNKMDLDLFEKIANLNNVEITKLSMFVRYYIIKDNGYQLTSKTETVKEFLSTEPILNYIQRKKKCIFLHLSNK